MLCHFSDAVQQGQAACFLPERSSTMDIRQLKYFLSVAETGLVTKAAEQLHMTQSPLSQQILALERELGVRLFRRTKKHMELTEAGQVLRRRAEQILSLQLSALAEVRETAVGMKGKLRLGLIPSSGRLWLPSFIRQFHEIYPLITFDLRQGSTEYILELMRHHQIDLGFVRLPVDDSLYRTIKFPPERIVAASLRSLLPESDGAVCLNQCEGRPLLVHRRYENIVRNYISREQGPLSLFCISDELLPLLTWAASGLGIALVPEFAAKIYPNPALAFRVISQPSVDTASALIWSRHEELPRAAAHFVEKVSLQRENKLI